MSFNLSKSDKTDMSVFPIQGLYTKLSVTEDLHLHGKNVIKNVYLREDFCVISCANFCSLPCFSCLQRNLCCLCLKFLFFFYWMFCLLFKLYRRSFECRSIGKFFTWNLFLPLVATPVECDSRRNNRSTFSG